MFSQAQITSSKNPCHPPTHDITQKAQTQKFSDFENRSWETLLF